ncbi:zinc finger and BTB domain-containing protein 7C [Sturnira hondurensis]|uniref:zinc finger and BTB domain-containing protein 7C n=1 Tax=Sturnira hondurensis TaxID=192404 RepID=UPI00187A9F68|nr:zinc finger and BTB domain-containing protein 7C [Sturnira hondurensis]XP_036889869.1 zinc finger and BTB domain-containing protein 7C [Sturnira hondurensis]XP_036889879.1 zinc finger and BTB domain-containing protein 7C [Sturnira hondurensis]
MANGIDELIGIPFPNHSSEVLCSLNEQRHDGLLCDVLLVVQEQEYRTHRSVLAACSKYFKKLFTAGTLASQPYVYEIDFVQPEALAAILEFAYTSTLTITASNVKHILNAARMLEIQCIVNVCLEIMEPGGDGGEEDDKEDDDDDEDDDDEEDEEEEEEEEDEEEDDDTEDFADQENLPDPQDVNCHQSPSKTDHLTEKAYSDTPRDFPDSFQTSSPGHLGVIRDFSIESLLRENLYPKANIPDRRPSLSPFAPDFFPHLWPGDFGAFAQLPEQPIDNGPLDLVIKNRKIKEEEKEELPPPPPAPFSNDFFKDMFPDLAGGPLSSIKSENDYGAYLNFLSAAHLGGLFPPWPLVEERKLKPKASQQCPICHKVIMGAGKLPRHMRTHTGEKPYMCNICEVRFTRQDKLKIHMRKHTGERPYLCIHCNAKFVHNYDLKNHMRIHTGVRPYQCEFCYKSFTRSDHLHRHIKRQSCRMARPRRGRKPAAWRAASLLFGPGGPTPEKAAFVMPPALGEVGSHLGGAAVCLPGPSPAKHFLTAPKGALSLQELERQFEETQMKLFGRAQLEAERNAGGLLAFALAENVAAARPYFPLPDPWATGLAGLPGLAGLNHVASMSEANN